jgi:hypothetical protein
MTFQNVNCAVKVLGNAKKINRRSKTFCTSYIRDIMSDIAPVANKVKIFKKFKISKIPLFVEDDECHESEIKPSNSTIPNTESRIGQPWNDSEENDILELIAQKKTYYEIADIHKRTYKGIKLRLNEISTKLYKNGMQLDEIQTKTGLSHGMIIKTLRKRGIEYKANIISEMPNSVPFKKNRTS